MEHADVILDTYILGKTLIESFLNQDNPVNWDTSGHVRTNGGCCFLMTDARNRIYKSQEFKNWLQEHNASMNNIYADFPLGNFAPGHKKKLDTWFNEYRLGGRCQVDIQITRP